MFNKYARSSHYFQKSTTSVLDEDALAQALPLIAASNQRLPSNDLKFKYNKSAPDEAEAETKSSSFSLRPSIDRSEVRLTIL